MEELVIWEASGHAKVVIDIARRDGRFEIACVLDSLKPDGRLGEFEGLPLLGGAETLRRLHDEGLRHVFIAVGDCDARLRMAEEARALGCQFPSLVHPSAVIAETTRIGNGVLVAAGAIVNPSSHVGDFVILNTASSVDHDCVIGDGAHIGPGTHLAGGVHVGRASFLGVGCSVIPGVRIGNGTHVGAGAVVLKDLPDGVVAYGVPAIIHAERNPG